MMLVSRGEIIYKLKAMSTPWRLEKMVESHRLVVEIRVQFEFDHDV